MNKIKIISILLALELIYIIVRLTPNVLATFDPAQVISYALMTSILILLLVSAVGIFFEKKWAIISFWVYILLPLLAGFSAFIGFIGGYYLVVFNVIIATYLAVQWNKFNKNSATYRAV